MPKSFLEFKKESEMLSLSVEKVFPIISKKKDLENRMKEIEKLETETD